jgi:hypothetical protein
MYSAIHSITMMKEQSLEDRPYIQISPMFAEDVGWIDPPRYVGDVDVTCSDCFPYEMEQQHIMSFMQFRMDMGSAFDYRFVVTEDVALLPNRYTQILHSCPQIDYLLDRYASLASCYCT